MSSRRQRRTEQRGRYTRTAPQQRGSLRWERERRRQRLTMVIAAMVILLVLAIPAIGYYNSFVAPPRRWVAKVNDETITLGYLGKVVAMNAVGVTSEQQSALASLPFQMLNNLVRARLVRQKAGGLGIAVTPDEVEQGLRDRFYPRVPEGQQADTAQLDREYKEQYRQFLNQVKLSDQEYREIVRDQSLQDKLREQLGLAIPPLAEHVFAHWIVVGDFSVADQVDSKLKAGEDFAALATQYNQDTFYANQQGEVGWVPKGAFPDLDAALFKETREQAWERVDLGEVTYFIQVTGVPETREVALEMRELLKRSSLDQWVEEQYKTNDVKVSFDSDDYEWVMKRVRISAQA
ncbi:MAG: SurA N-terminal domain-containing protein [Chloroflexi bacterium]|nr:SurA N-terminal domain-containing protein [Chloroflexota bacterium]